MKSFKEYLNEEPTMNTNSGIAGTGTGDVADWKTKKPRKHQVLTRGYIEIMGKRKKLVK